MDLVENMPLSIVKKAPYAFDKSYLSYCYRFVTLMLIMPPLSGIQIDLDMEFESNFCKGSPFVGVLPKMIIYMSHAILKF